MMRDRPEVRESFAVPNTMRAAVMYAEGDIRIEERAVPVLEPGDALLRMAACGVCGSDMMPWYVRKKAPFVFGHEPAGTIVALAPAGDDAAPVRVGERVFAHHHVPCFACEECAAGRYVHCARWRATSLDPGGMAEYVRVPRANFGDLFALPSGMSFVDGSLIEPLACVVKSLRRAFPDDLRAGVVPERPYAEPPLRGKMLYMIGAGATGLMHTALATHLGARVIVSDLNANRLAVARELGALEAVAPEAARDALLAHGEGRLADAVISGPSTPAVIGHAVECVRNDGTVIMFTPIDPEKRFEFDQSPAYFRDVRLIASYSCGPDDTRESARAVARGTIDAAALRVARFAFPAVEEAYREMQRGTVTKAVVAFEEAGG